MRAKANCLKLFICLMLGFSILLFGPLGGHAAAQKVLKAAAAMGPTNPSFIGFEKFLKVFESKTKGKYKIEIYHSGQLGSTHEILQSVKMGIIHFTSNDFSQVARFTDAFLPLNFFFLFNDPHQALKVLRGPVVSKFFDRYEKESNGLKGLGWIPYGFRVITITNKPVRTPEDCKGLKIRSMENEIHLASFRAMGFNAVPMSIKEVYMALKMGVIDGQDNPVPNLISWKFHEIQKYTTLTNHLLGLGLISVNRDFFNSLPDEEKKMLHEAAIEAGDFSANRLQKTTKEGIKFLKEKGITVIELTPKERKAFVEAVKPVYFKYEDRVGKETLAAILKAAGIEF